MGLCKIKYPVASGDCTLQTPCFRNTIFGLALPSANPRSAPAVFYKMSNKKLI